MSTFATIGVVAALLVLAARWWQRGEQRDPPPLIGAFRVWLVASLVLWAAAAIAPRFLA